MGKNFTPHAKSRTPTTAVRLWKAFIIHGYRQSVLKTSGDLATGIWKLHALICHAVCRVNVILGEQWSNCISYNLERGGSSSASRWKESLSIPVTPEHKYSVETPKRIKVMQIT